MKPTPDQINALCKVLEGKLSTRFVNILLGEEKLDLGLFSDDIKSLTTRKKLEVLAHRKGSQFFSGSHQLTKELREKLILSLNESRVHKLFEESNIDTSGLSVKHRARKLAEQRWVAGKSWPLKFCRVMGIPKIYAGLRPSDKPPDIEEIDPLFKPPELTNFQIELKENLLDILEKRENKTRCIVSLPTGGGKTRTAVEAFIQWLQPRFANGLYLIWIAQSEELCNQAIECIKQLWAAKEFNETLRVYRYFGGTKIDVNELEGGVVVSTIHQLHYRLKKKEKTVTEIISKTGSVIIDEAHRAATDMYKSFFDYCKELHSEDLFPVCGLTATPGRSFDDTPRLVDVFESTLFTPTLPEEFDKNPLEYFRKNGYLARPKARQIKTNFRVKVTDDLKVNYPGKKEFEVLEEEIIDDKLIKDLASDEQRNRLIIDKLRKIPKGKQTIVYACTVKHAEDIATVLCVHGRSAASISAKTPRHYRRKLVEQFKNNDIEFLVNYGVLTTGFDAPKTEYIVLCRPTFSEVLYEQIVGRGLRGPKFGGTEYCEIIDFEDNFDRFGDQLAYTRFSDFWETDQKY